MCRASAQKDQYYDGKKRIVQRLVLPVSQVITENKQSLYREWAGATAGEVGLRCEYIRCLTEVAWQISSLLFAYICFHGHLIVIKAIQLCWSTHSKVKLIQAKRRNYLITQKAIDEHQIYVMLTVPKGSCQHYMQIKRSRYCKFPNLKMEEGTWEDKSSRGCKHYIWPQNLKTK